MIVEWCLVINITIWTTFEWAKKFLCSAAPLALVDKDTETMHLAIPKRCPTTAGLIEDRVESQGPIKKKIVIVDTDVR